MVYTDALQSIAMIVGLVVCISFAVAKLDGESGMLAPPDWCWRTLRFERDVGVVYICVCVTSVSPCASVSYAHRWIDGHVQRAAAPGPQRVVMVRGPARPLPDTPPEPMTHILVVPHPGCNSRS